MSAGHHDHKKTYVAIFVALLSLTVITVLAVDWDLSHIYKHANIILAMLIATIKATLVGLFFMHLNEDKKENVVIFISSFLFLLIFIALAAGDVFTREDVSQVKIKPVEVPAALQTAKMSSLIKSSDAQIEKGKNVYSIQCATCHGAEGKGNGPAAAAFNPAPRNFTLGEFEKGGSPAQLYDTLIKGLRSMPAFSSLSVEDRWAVVHYIRTFIPNPVEDTPETLALVGLSADGSVDPSLQKEVKPELPIEFIMERMLDGK